jgi:Zn-dependent metalloprotease
MCLSTASRMSRITRLGCAEGRERMTSTETYAKARLDTVAVATTLYGASSPEVAAVKAAWSAVSVNWPTLRSLSLSKGSF